MTTLSPLLGLNPKLHKQNEVCNLKKLVQQVFQTQLQTETQALLVVQY